VTPQQKQRAQAAIGTWHSSNDDSLREYQSAELMAALLQELIEQPTSVPVLTVECEPDYWSGGHYHEGTMPHIDPTAVWNLPIGTKLYTSPPAPIVPEAALVRDAAPDIWRVMCGDWREETVAIHNSEGWIADGLDLKKAAALVEAHNGSLGLGVEASGRDKKGGAA